MGNVTALQTATRTPQGTAKPIGPRLRKRLSRQRLAAVGLGGVAVALTALSLSHLAHGVQMVTGSLAWEAWAMAVGIDLGFVALELGQIAVTTETLRKQVARYSKPAIIGTLAGSAVMNAFAFAAPASGWCMTSAAIVLGVAIPALVYCLTRIGACLYIDGSK